MHCSVSDSTLKDTLFSFILNIHLNTYCFFILLHLLPIASMVLSSSPLPPGIDIAFDLHCSKAQSTTCPTHVLVRSRERKAGRRFDTRSSGAEGEDRRGKDDFCMTCSILVEASARALDDIYEPTRCLESWFTKRGCPVPVSDLVNSESSMPVMPVHVSCLLLETGNPHVAREVSFDKDRGQVPYFKLSFAGLLCVQKKRVAMPSVSGFLLA